MLPLHQSPIMTKEGLEPSRLSTTDPKSVVSAIPPLGQVFLSAIKYTYFQYVSCKIAVCAFICFIVIASVGLEPTRAGS